MGTPKELALEKQKSGDLLLGLQYLRFIAALLVVLAHAWQMVPVVGTGGEFVGASFPGGASGVDMFFVISGFIMVHITTQRPVGPGQFMLDRVARISPPYWVITFLMAAVLIVAPNVFRSASFDMATLLTSLLFIPWPSTAVPGTAPLLQIGWTLNYEMFFYAIFALAMMVSRANRIAIAAGVILALVSMQLIWPNDANDFFQFYSSSIMIEFVFGMLIALLVNRSAPRQESTSGSSRASRYKISAQIFSASFTSASRNARPALLTAAMMIALCFWAWSLTFDVGRLSQMRFIIWGLPAAMIVACIVAVDLRGVVPYNRLLLLLGNASYAIYLTHLFPLGALRKVWPMMPEFIRASDMLLLLFAVALALAVGIGFFLFVEKPLVKLAKAVAVRLHVSRKVAAPI
jgi:exopolysaccharide production protein ExoZ